MQYTVVAGVDEVGRGPLAGPVIAAAVILDPDFPIVGLRDSKRLSESQRELWYGMICDQAAAIALGRAEATEIDELNILRASLLAMQRAILQLPITPEQVQVDGLHAPQVNFPVQTIVQGDSLVPAISAASIIAKVTRDHEMVGYDEMYPGYGFARHKGYPTREHLERLRRLGPTPIHRRSFAPVRRTTCRHEDIAS